LVKQIGVHDGATDVTDMVLVAFGIVVGALVRIPGIMFGPPGHRDRRAAMTIQGI
jgi:hypothetical protein